MSWQRSVSALLSILTGALAPCFAPAGSLAPPTAITAIRNDTFERRDFPWSQNGAQAALDWVKENGGRVILGAGELTLDRALIVWDREVLEGLGRNTKLKLAGEPTSRIPALCVGSHCRVANMNIVGTGYLPHDRTPYNSKGVVAGTTGQGGMEGTTIEGCYLSDWNTTAIDLMSHSKRNVLRNNSISRSGWEGIYVAIFCDSNDISHNAILDCRRNAIDVVGSHNLVVGNTVRGVGLDSLEFAWDTYGILVYSNRDWTGHVSGNVVRGNTVESCYDGIAVLASNASVNEGTVVEGNDVFQNRRYGIWVGSASAKKPYAIVQDINIRGNEVRQNAKDGIILKPVSRRVGIVDNHIFENGTSGIHIQSAPEAVDSVVIRENVVHNNREMGVEIDSLVVRSLITENVIARNGGVSIRDTGIGTTVVRNRAE